MMTSNACDAGRLQAEQRKRSKYRIIMMPSNASDASQEAPGRPAQNIKTPHHTDAQQCQQR
jgi:hypothetical protein